MINFKPFQHLYQQVKKTDIILFQAFDKISFYLEQLSNIEDKEFDFGQLPIFPNNATALLHGLKKGEPYRTGADPDHVCVVH